MTQATKLESYVRKVIQPPPRGFISPEAMKVHGGSNSKQLDIESGISRMLLSTVIQHIVAYGAVGKDKALEATIERIEARTSTLTPYEQAKEHELIQRHLAVIDNSTQITAEFIVSLCWLLTYAPVSCGGCRKYPDGGYVVPTMADTRLIWELSRRSYRFIHKDRPESVEFKATFDVNAAHFDTATIDFLTESAAYKISPLTSIPQPRDTLLVYVWATLAGVERFGIYNPLWDTLHWARITDIDKDIRQQIEREILVVS